MIIIIASTACHRQDHQEHFKFKVCARVSLAVSEKNKIVHFKLGALILLMFAVVRRSLLPDSQVVVKTIEV